MDTACGHSLHVPGCFRMGSGASGRPAILVDVSSGLGHESSGKVEHDDCAMPQHGRDGGEVDLKSSTDVAGFDCLGSGWMEVKKKGKSFSKLLATKSAGGQKLPVEAIYGQQRGDVLDGAEPTSGALGGGTATTAPDPQHVMIRQEDCNQRLTTSLGDAEEGSSPIFCSVAEVALTVSENELRVRSSAEHSCIAVCCRNCPCGTDYSQNMMDSESSSKQQAKDTPRFRWGDLDDDDLTVDHKDRMGLGSCPLVTEIVLVQTSPSVNSVKYEEVDQLKDEQASTCADAHHEPDVLEDGGGKYADTHSDSALCVQKTGDNRSCSPQGTKTLEEDSADSVPLHSSAVRVVYPEGKVDSKELADEVNVDMSNPMELLNGEEQQAVMENERFQSRLWCFLFENLNRAIDELYFLCELECDSLQMEEALLVLTEAGLDFKELKARAEAFEKVRKESGVTGNIASVSSLGLCKGEYQRPHAIAWEVRRIASSPRRAEILLSSLEAFKRAQLDRVHENDIDNKGIKGATSSLASHRDMPPSKQGSMSQSGLAIKGAARRQLAPLAATGPETTFTDIRELKGPCPTEIFVSQESCLATVPGESLLNTSPAPHKLNTKDQGSPGNMTVQCLADDSSYNDSNETGALSGKGREVLGSIGSINALEAWKEKRNWEDILTSPLRGSSCPSRPPSTGKNSMERVRILHDKLMSPDKRKKSPLEMKKQVDEKQARATKLRMGLENERVQRLQRTTEKLNRVSEWQAVRSSRLREGMHARQQRGESRHEAHLAQIARRASAESSKVSEVRFITSLNEENRKLSLQQKLQDSEVRRAERLQSIRIKQKEDVAKEEAALERRKLLEAERLQRIADAQRKKDEATARREEERKAASAAREARAIEQVRKKEVRAKAQQEEAILLGQKLAEKLRESSARRKFYLEQIRERAGTESDKNEKRRDCQFDSPSRKCKDQGSVLLRPSSSGDRLVRGSCHYTENVMTLDRDVMLGKGLGNKATNSVGAGDPERSGTNQQTMKKRVKKVRQRLAARKFEFTEPPSGAESAGLGSSSVNSAALSRIGRWLQDLQKHLQPRKSGSLATLSVVEEIVKYLDGKEAELHAARQSALLDYVATALPASHSSKVETSKSTIALLHLLIVLLTIPANRSYFIARNLSPPLVPMLSTVLESFCNLGSSSAATTFSGNSVGGPNDASVERSMMDERLEITGEILEGLLLALIAIMDHHCKDERLLLMQDDLVELVVGCEVIHRLCNLFALFDRPQVEGAPIPAAVRLGLKLLETLTGRAERSSTPIADNAISLSGNFLEKVSDMRHSMLHHPAGRRWMISGEVTPFTDNHPQGSTCSHADDRIYPTAGNPYGDDDEPLQGEGHMNYPSGSAVGAMGAFKEAKASKMEGRNRPYAEDHDLSQDPAIQKSTQSKWSAPNVSKGASCPEYNTYITLNRCAGLLLAVSLETGLIGLTSLLTAVLLQANPRSSPIQAASALPSNFDEVATSVLSILNNLARLDLFLIQNVLATPDLRVEFFHLVSFLLSHCTCKWKSASDQVASLLLETLLLLGYFALLHPENQAVLRWGKTPTILHKICDLPFAFFSDSQLTPVLNGTLLATCYGCVQNRDVVQQELSLKTLVSFLRSAIEGATTSTTARVHKTEAVDVTSERGVPQAQCKSAERETVSGDSEANMPGSTSVPESNILLNDKDGSDVDVGAGSNRRNLSTGCSSVKQLSEAASSPRKPLRNGSKPGSQSAGSQTADGDSSVATARGPSQNRMLSKGPVASPGSETFLFPFKKNKGVSVGVAGGFSKFSEVYTPLPSRLCVPVGISPVGAEACKVSSTVGRSRVFLLENRFPRSLWTHAEEFFSSEL